MGEDAYKEDPSSTLGKLWHGRTQYITSPHSFVPLVRNGLVSVSLRQSLEMLNGAYFSKHGECAYYLAKRGFVGISYSVLLPKGSPLRSPIDKLFQRLIEVGIMAKLRSDVSANLTACPQPLNPQGTDSLRPLGLADLQGVAALFAIGEFTDSTTVLDE
ncbi:uncharacterized protein LOC143037012 [Oratosquilla oratoria]|uniref:uncharacterized protein LOC143037012 n=1 Tax=Oratosquilla oratoria TaxID=337810 RepID=UPI003F7730D9